MSAGYGIGVNEMAKETYQFFKLIEKNSAREVYGKKLAEVGKVNPRIVVLTADLMRTNKTGDVLFRFYQYRGEKLVLNRQQVQ